MIGCARWRPGVWAIVVSIGLCPLFSACLMTIDEDRIGARGPDASPGPDAGEDALPEAAPPGILCGGGVCAKGMVCCSATFAETRFETGHCILEGDCESGDWYACQKSADCPADKPACCALLPGGAFNKTECRAACPDRVLCDPARDACPQGRSCEPSETFRPLSECL